jgi:O-antigen/teichoic acid export membrane protein
MYSVAIARVRRARSLLRLRPFDVSTEEGRSSERYRRILLTTATSLVVRCLSAVIGFVSVPLTLTYLGKTQYGFWSLISTAVTWFSLLGFNITGGLRNALAEAHGREDFEAASAYVTTATAVLVGLATVLSLLVVAIGPFLNWSAILGVSSEIPRSLAQQATVVGFVLFLLALPAAIPSTVFAALQRQYVSNLIGLAGTIISLVSLVVAIRMKVSISGLLVALNIGTFVSAFGTQLYLRRVEPGLRLSLKRVSRPAFRRIAKTSVPMIAYQVGALMVNETQQIIIARRIDLSTVTSYSIIIRIVVLVSSVVNLSTAGFLPAFREAKERGDLAWMRRALSRMTFARVALAATAGTVLVLFGNALVRLWLRRDDLVFARSTWIVVLVGVTSSTWVTSFVDFMSALDDLWKQVVMVLLNGVISITLSVILSRAFGLTGILVATYAVTVVLWSWIIPLVARTSHSRS